MGGRFPAFCQTDYCGGRHEGLSPSYLVVLLTS
jgi:hypothetical protein